MALSSTVSSSITTISGSSSTTELDTSSKNVTRAISSGKDTLGVTATSITNVYQGSTTYVEGKDFSLSTNNSVIAWGVDSSGNNLSNADIPSSGSVYTVVYTTNVSISLGTYSASISNNADDSTYISLSLKDTKTVVANEDLVKADIQSFITLVMNKLQAVDDTVPASPTNVSSVATTNGAVINGQ